MGIASPQSRNAAIDRVRTASTALLVVYHACQTFDTTDLYHMKAPKASQLQWLTCATLFCRVWHMPLFFLIAGWSLQNSLASRGLLSVLAERSSKLLPPLAFGMVAFGPFLRWIELQHGLLKTVHGKLIPAEDCPPFLEFIPQYFIQPGLVTWAHLWFLAYLWTFTIIYAPLWVAFRSKLGNGAEWARSNPVLCIPVLAVALSEMSLRERWPGYQNLFDDWANFATYGVFLLTGLVLGHAPVLCQTLSRCSRALLVGGIVASVWQVSLRVQGIHSVIYHLMTALGAYGCAAGIVGWALKGPTPRSKGKAAQTLDMFQRAAFPMYVLHQVVLVALAEYFVLRIPLGAHGQLVVLIMVGFSASGVLYALTNALPVIPYLVFGGSCKSGKKASTRS